MKNLIIKSLAISVISSSALLADMDRCVSCHGVDFEKKALGVSKVVKGMSEKQIKLALDGYKKGLGGSMKELMMQEVNLGVDTDAMAADVYSETLTPGFDEPNDEFIFQKRLSVRTLDKLKKSIKKANHKKDMKKISAQIKTAAFTMYTYDNLLNKTVKFENFKPSKSKLSMQNILNTVTNVKKCVDHSFSEKEIVKCRIEFLNLAGAITQNEANKIRTKQKANKLPIYTGEGAVDISKYLKDK